MGFNKKLSCFKSTIRKNFTNPNLNVIIENHDIVERSFLAANYTMFHIKVVP